MMYTSSLALFIALAAARNNGVGKLPVMGYDTYNAFNGDYDGQIALEQVQAMSRLGLVDLGYNTVRSESLHATCLLIVIKFILDDYYSNINRSSTGELEANSTRFPDGMVAWTNSVTAYNISVSAYSSNGKIANTVWNHISEANIPHLGYMTCAGTSVVVFMIYAISL